MHTLLGPESEWPTEGPVPGWITRSGKIGLRRDVAETVETRDLLAAREVATRYGWGVDERRADLLEELFTPRVEWSGTVEGHRSLGRVRGLVAVLDLLKILFWSGSAQFRHLTSSAIVERQNSTSAAICQGFMLTFSNSVGSNVACTGVNRFDLVKDEAGWSIAGIFAGFDSVDRVPGAASLSRGKTWP